MKIFKQVMIILTLILAIPAPICAAEVVEETVVVEQPTRYEQARDYFVNKITTLRNYLKQRGISKKEALAITITLIGLYAALRKIQVRAGKPAYTPPPISDLPDIQTIANLQTIKGEQSVQYKGEQYYVVGTNPFQLKQEKFIYEVMGNVPNNRYLQYKFFITDQVDERGISKLMPVRGEK